MESEPKRMKMDHDEVKNSIAEPTTNDANCSLEEVQAKPSARGNDTQSPELEISVTNVVTDSNDPSHLEAESIDSASQCDDCQEAGESANSSPGSGSHTRCMFFMEKKKRLCKMQRVRGELYCSDHLEPAGIKKEEKKRVVCPFDSNHSCYAHLLEKHLKKCNSRPELRPMYFAWNINAGDLEGVDPSLFKLCVRDVPEEEILKFVDRVQSLHKDVVGELRKDVQFHEVLREESEKSTNGLSAQKHIYQQASLIGLMEKLGLLTSNSAFVEFGAGKGGLSHWVQLALANVPDVQYYLVEKSGVRYKMDNFHKDKGPSFERLRLNIADLDLGKVKGLLEKEMNVVGIGKHLCGGATDLMLRCLVETYIKTKEPKLSHLQGVVLALCCHHQCDWKSYVGKSFMKEFGFTARDFHLLTRLTSWAVSRNQFDPRAKRDRNSKEIIEQTDDSLEGANIKKYGLTRDEREEIGYKCKQLIDEGRRRYLAEAGYKVEIVYYTDKERTLENMAMLASQLSSS